MPNMEIREAIRRKRLRHFEVARALGINRCTFSTWLSEELSDEKKHSILKTIEKIKI